MKIFNLFFIYSLTFSLLINGINNDPEHTQKIKAFLELLGNNQSDKLKACQDLACVEKLLRAKEEKIKNLPKEIFISLIKNKKDATHPTDLSLFPYIAKIKELHAQESKNL